MRRAIWLLVLGLAACSTPAPAAAPTPQPADFTTVDACALLAESDFPKPFTKAPEALASPGSCRWTTEAHTVWMSIENEPLEEAKSRVRDGSELPLGERKGWWGVTSDHRAEPQTSTGIVMAELAPDRVLVVQALRTPPRYDIGMVARERAQQILQRLVK